MTYHDLASGHHVCNDEISVIKGCGHRSDLSECIMSYGAVD